MLRPALNLTIAALLVLAPLPAATPEPDRVDRKKGAPVAGVEIVSEDYKTVVVKARKKGRGSAKTTRIPADQVLDVRRDDEPPAYQNGRSALLEGDLVNAIAQLKLATTQAGGKAWITEYASFYLAEAYRQAGKGVEAAAAYERVLQVKADSRFLPRVRIGLAQAHMAAKRYAQAESVLKAFVKEVDAKRLAASYRIEASLLLGRNQAAQGRHGEAASHYSSVVTEARNQARKAEKDEEKEQLLSLALQAETDKGLAMIEAKNYSGAQSIFSGMARAGRNDPRAQMLSVLGRGATALGQGNLDVARILLTEAATVHFKAEAERPRALLLLGKTYSALDNKGENGARQKAKTYYQDLIRLYPASSFVSEARKLLAAM